MLPASQGSHFTGGFSGSHQLSPEIALSNKFPGKLWRLVNSCKTGAIQWGSTGNTIIIHQVKSELYPELSARYERKMCLV